MHTVRSTAVFGFLYFAVLLAALPTVEAPTFLAIACAAAGILVTFPFDRIGPLSTWIGKSPRRTREFRTCAIASGSLGRARRDRRFIGTVRGVR